MDLPAGFIPGDREVQIQVEVSGRIVHGADAASYWIFIAHFKALIPNVVVDLRAIVEIIEAFPAAARAIPFAADTPAYIRGTEVEDTSPGPSAGYLDPAFDGRLTRTT